MTHANNEMTDKCFVITLFEKICPSFWKWFIAFLIGVIFGLSVMILGCTREVKQETVETSTIIACDTIQVDTADLKLLDSLQRFGFVRFRVKVKRISSNEPRPIIIWYAKPKPHSNGGGGNPFPQERGEERW